MWRPRKKIHGSGVLCVSEDDGPIRRGEVCIRRAARRGAGARILAPDEDAPVVRGRGKDGSVFGMSPGNAPHCCVVALERVGQAVRLAFDLENFDCLV